MTLSRALLALLLLLPACATLTAPEGGRPMRVESAPPGAACEVWRDSVKVGEIASAPGEVLFTEAQRPLIVLCRWPNEVALGSAVVRPELNPAVLGNLPLLLGAGIGASIDIQSGAANRYPDTVVVVIGGTIGITGR